MPEELDPTTARLAAELASNILPPLSKSLSSAMPSADFTGLFERISKSSQEVRNQIEKIIRSDIEENRVGRSVVMQSIGNILEDISSVKRAVEKFPSNFDVAIKSRPETLSVNTQELTKKLDNIQGLLEEVIHGIKSFYEAYATDKENYASPEPQQIYSGNDAQLEKLLTTSLPNLEGLVRANAKSQSKELEEFSREISALHEENNAALIHEVSKNVSGELAKYNDETLIRLNDEQDMRYLQIMKMVKIMAGISGACVIMTLITMIIMFLK